MLCLCSEAQAAPRNRPPQRKVPDMSTPSPPPLSFGDVPWTANDLRGALEEFATIYEQRPIRDNHGGMKSAHMFATWFALRRLAPKVVIESGVFLGQGTWLIERACPEAKLYCIDPLLDRIQYRSSNATYLDGDFKNQDWSALPTADTLVFFDDHQNAYERLKQCRWIGFQHLMFEDNYPPGKGDCYSLKKAWAGAGFKAERKPTLKQKLLGTPADHAELVAPNQADAAYMRRNLEVYYEFPPVFRPAQTRWGDEWDERYPTPDPLLREARAAFEKLYADEAKDYTWISYVRLAA